MINFDQFTEYVTVDGVFPVALDQHALESPYTLVTVAGGYRNAARLGHALVAGAELALVFSEWDAQTGLPDATGIVAAKILAPWPAKGVAAAYVVATSALLDIINAQRTIAIALIRMAPDNDNNPLAPDEPFTPAQVTALATWLNNHGVTNTEFAALFNVTAAQLSGWLAGHPRWQFAQQLHERFA